MLSILFAGYYQYRAALDPDPTDEPRGRSGPTFALPGEPDFDAAIRLQDIQAPRYPHETDGGVFVTAVTVGGQPAPGHPLIGAAVDLLPVCGRWPKFEERGYIVTYQRVPIDPFCLQIRTAGLSITRSDYWDVSRPELTVIDVSKHYPELIPRRQPTVAPQSVQVAEATGIMDYARWRRQRSADLQHILATTVDPIRRAALKKRIDDLAKDDQGMSGVTVAAQQFLGLCATYQFDLNGAIVIDDKDDRLGGTVGTAQTWPLAFWTGGYDVDSLFAYMAGSLSLPFWPRPPAK